MAHAEKSIIIERTAQIIFDFLMEGKNNLHWRESVLDIERLNRKANGVVAVFKQGLKGPAGKRMDGDYEITKCTPHELIAFRVIAGPARPTGVYRIESLGESSRLSLILDFQANAFNKLLEPIVQQTMNAEVAMLLNLKAYLEKQG